MPDLKIRDCVEEDIPGILEIENASFDDPYPQSLFLAFRRRFPRGFRVAESEGQIVGYCIISPWKNKQTMIITSLAVRPEFKRSKIATNLLKDALLLAKVSPTAMSILLQVAVDNIAAITLYEKFGFVHSRLIKNYYGKNRDGIQMELVLKREEPGN
ncbi:MAG: GNAT family N-acetyltransferase [Nitrososphaerales archaeon]